MSTTFARGGVCHASRWWVRNGHRQARTKVVYKVVYKVLYDLEPEDERLVPLSGHPPSNAAASQDRPTGGKSR